jgi:hypothetical protein
MKILCTFPGRYGDLLWALPTMRALSRRINGPVDLQIGGEFASLVPLLQYQDYLGEVWADTRWALTPPNEWCAPNADHRAGPFPDQVVHLGYRGWPQTGLPFETCANLRQYPASGALMTMEELALHEPWITLPDTHHPPADLVIAFSETHFELKLGTTLLVLEQLARHAPNVTYRICTTPRSRWVTDLWPTWSSIHPGTWMDYAVYLQGARVALCCNSGAHVLAVAMGVPVVMYEPMEARWNPIFLPLGDRGPQVTLVRGNDGMPTTDARHTLERIAAVLADSLKESQR